MILMFLSLHSIFLKGYCCGPNFMDLLNSASNLQIGPTNVFISNLLGEYSWAVSPVDRMDACLHITPFLTEIAIQGNYQLFKRILMRDNLVDWELEDKNKLMDYRYHWMHIGDVADLTRVILKMPVLKSLEYNSIDEKIRDSFVDFIIDNQDHLSAQRENTVTSPTGRICTYIVNYLAFTNDTVRLDTFLDFTKRNAIPIIIDGALNYALYKDHVQVLKILIQKKYLDQIAYDSGFRHVCIRASKAAFQVYLKDAHVKTKEDFEFERVFSTFHGKDWILKGLLTHPFTQEKLSIPQYHTSIKAIQSKDTLTFLKNNELHIRDMLFIAAKLFDNAFLRFVLLNFDLESLAILGFSSHLSFFGNLEMIQFLLSNDMLRKFQGRFLLDDFLREVVIGASMGAQLFILKHLRQKNLLKSFHVIYPGLNHAVQADNWPIMEFFVEEFPEFFKPADILLLYMTTKKTFFSSSIILGLVNFEGFDLESCPMLGKIPLDETLISSLSSNLHSVQLIMENPKTRLMVTEKLVYGLLDYSIQENRRDVLEWFLSSPRLFSLLSLTQWHAFETRIYHENVQSLKKVFQTRGSALYHSIGHPSHGRQIQ